MKRAQFHVVYRKASGGWHVENRATDMGIGTFPTKLEAVQLGMEIARRANGQLIIHLKNGRIQEERTYTKDPRRFKG